MPAPADPRVDAYIASQARDMQPILVAARTRIREALPDATETIKWGYPTYVGAKNIVALMVFPESANLQFFRGMSLPDPKGKLTGTGKEMRHVEVAHVKDLKDPAVQALLRAAGRLDKES